MTSFHLHLEEQCERCGGFGRWFDWKTGITICPACKGLGTVATEAGRIIMNFILKQLMVCNKESRDDG
jgi:DnaJ-class molecular chaperone